VDLYRVHAFTVEPSRTLESAPPPAGGRIAITSELQGALERNLKSACFDSRTAVDFDVDPATRTNVVRDEVMSYAFGSDDAADTVADSLANRLSQAMDLRSPHCLFVLTAVRRGEARSVILWTFPRDDAFQFEARGGAPLLRVLTDVFSQSSKLRKAARFQGEELRNHFLSGRALDFQSSSTSLEIANFWIVDFLDCRFGLTQDGGTNLLARTLRAAVAGADDAHERDQLVAAMLSLRHSPRSRWSLKEVADQYLSGRARQRLLDSVPDTATRVATFELNRELFERELRYRVFTLDTGVVVSSPVDEVGQSVSVSEGERRRLSCAGDVVGEKVRTRSV
jgi:hypothetical protein